MQHWVLLKSWEVLQLEEALHEQWPQQDQRRQQLAWWLQFAASSTLASLWERQELAQLDFEACAHLEWAASSARS